MRGLSPAAPGASGGDLGSLETRSGLFYLAPPLSPAVCHPGSRANSGLGVWGGQPGRAAGDALSLGDGEGCTVGFGPGHEQCRPRWVHKAPFHYLAGWWQLGGSLSSLGVWGSQFPGDSFRPVWRDISAGDTPPRCAHTEPEAEASGTLPPGTTSETSHHLPGHVASSFPGSLSLFSLFLKG